MNANAFKKAYGESRNGANQFFRHGLARGFVFSDGVNDCANAGCHWLVDIAATELPAVLRREDENMGTLTATVKKGKAVLTMTGSGDVHLWSRKIDYTDMPDGKWLFLITVDGPNSVMILLSEY